MTWRLYVATESVKDKEVIKKYLSVYTGIVNGASNSNYEYIVELIHPTENKITSLNNVTNGEWHGEDKFIKIDRLIQDGYIDKEGAITFKFKV
jgi:hypothetical protein